MSKDKWSLGIFLVLLAVKDITCDPLLDDDRKYEEGREEFLPTKAAKVGSMPSGAPATEVYSRPKRPTDTFNYEGATLKETTTQGPGFDGTEKNAGRGSNTDNTTDSSDVINLRIKPDTEKLFIFGLEAVLCKSESKRMRRCQPDSCEHTCQKTGECPIGTSVHSLATTNKSLSTKNTDNSHHHEPVTGSSFFQKLLTDRANKSLSQFMSCEEITIDPLGKHHINVHMVSSCPTTVPLDLTYYKQLCELNRLPGSATMRLYMQTHVWVGTILYKNIYCALCHGYATSAAEIEPPYYRCRSERAKKTAMGLWSLVGIEGLLGYVMRTCDSYYRMLGKAEITGDIECDPAVISKCPDDWMTKENADYRAGIQAACNAYSSPVKVQLTGAAYKNSHCAKCNGANVSSLQCYEHRASKAAALQERIRSTEASFLVKLNFDEPTRPVFEYNGHIVCDGYAYLDPLNQECIFTDCPLGFVQVAGHCVDANMSLPITDANTTGFKTKVMTLIFILESSPFITNDEGFVSGLLTYLHHQFPTLKQARNSGLLTSTTCESFINTFTGTQSILNPNITCLRIDLDNDYRNNFQDIANSIRLAFYNFDITEGRDIHISSIVGINHDLQGFSNKTTRCLFGEIAFKPIRLIKDTYFYENSSTDYIFDTYTGAIYDSSHVPVAMVGNAHATENLKTFAMLCAEPILTCKDVEIYDSLENITSSLNDKHSGVKHVYKTLREDSFVVCNHQGEDTTLNGTDSSDSTTITSKNDPGLPDMTAVYKNYSLPDVGNFSGHDLVSKVVGKYKWRPLLFHIFTLTGTSISIISLVATILTFLIFKPLRTLTGFCIIQLSLSVLLLQISSEAEMLIPKQLNKKLSTFCKEWAMTSGFIWLSLTLQYTTQTFGMNSRCMRPRVLAVFYLFIGWSLGVPFAEIPALLENEKTEKERAAYSKTGTRIQTISWGNFVPKLLVIGICIVKLLQCRYHISTLQSHNSSSAIYKSGRKIFRFSLSFFLVLVIHWVLTLLLTYFKLGAISCIHVLVCTSLGLFVFFSWTVQKSTRHMFKDMIKKSSLSAEPESFSENELIPNNDVRRGTELISLNDIQTDGVALRGDKREEPDGGESDSSEEDPLAQSNVPLTIRGEAASLV